MRPAEPLWHLHKALMTSLELRVSMDDERLFYGSLSSSLPEHCLEEPEMNYVSVAHCDDTRHAADSGAIKGEDLEWSSMSRRNRLTAPWAMVNPPHRRRSRVAQTGSEWVTSQNNTILTYRATDYRPTAEQDVADLRQPPQ
ncbi:hypothetical protein EVAR_74267_1 [Eumeta japonica]|uniref:Uncharacterized protein n=1 Tax=Eumeta variegata TaxID=151549 RepID=A0A4C1SCI7_EUMVA|nr:hypothetical protein EVAR_74267_1 [Eumeta japonica]